MIAAGAYCWFRPLPAARISSDLVGSTPGAAYALPFPSTGTAAVAVEGLGLVAGRGVDVRLSTASLAKVILALCVLEKAPLHLGQQGPAFTISAADVALYDEALTWNASTLGVVSGERLSEYQALQALMIPSADNIADSLVRWIFGSQAAYAAYAEAWLRAHQLTHTVIGPDASGLHAGTTSTARDLVGLGLIAMRNPVLAEIAAQPGAVFPVVGYKSNYDTALGQAGIAGFKTGNNGSNRGAFLFTSTVSVGGRRVDVAGVILGQPDLTTALTAAPPLMEAVRRGIRLDPIVSARQPVGQAVTPWGDSAPVSAETPLAVLRWVGDPVTVSVDESGPWLIAASGGRTNRVRLEIPSAAGPSFWWRLFRK